MFDSQFENVELHKILLFVAWAMVGGFANWLNRWKSVGFTRHAGVELLADLIYSGFCGGMSYLLCLHWNIDGAMTGIIVGMAGHQGARFIWALDRIVSTALYKGKD